MTNIDVHWNLISEQISNEIGEPFECTQVEPVSGGCINEAYRLSGSHVFFVKLNSLDQQAMFTAEYAGLLEIQASDSIRVPKPYCCGRADRYAFIAMEALDIGTASRSSAEQLGVDLAKMHQCTQQQFGWQQDNTIGSTPQLNSLSSDWVDFWQTQRLGPQLQLAANKGHTGRLQRRGDQLMAKLAAFFDSPPVVSLLHGDLWSGNYSILTDGCPAIYDPAVYYGDRETDIAMTELFGEFPAAFYSAYNEAYPLDVGYSTRKTLYNLYHILNHLNLFGSGYLSQAEDMIERLLSEV